MDWIVSHRHTLIDSLTVTDVFESIEENERMDIFLIRTVYHNHQMEYRRRWKEILGEQCDFVLGKNDG